MTVNLVCDFDGTISLEDVTDALLERFADPLWKEVEAQWLAGEIGSQECMARQVGLITAGREELDEFLDGLSIDPSFPSFLDACRRHREIALTVVSDGLDYAIRRILRNAGLESLAVRANALVALPGGRYRLDFPHASAACTAGAGNCKCTLAERSAGTYPTIVIGDGASDFCVASSADFVFAKKSLLAHCESERIPHLAFDTFADIERELPRVLARFRRRNAAAPMEKLSDAAG